MKGKFTDGGAGGTFSNLIERTEHGEVKWRLRLGHFVAHSGETEATSRVICIIDRSFTEARLIIPEYLDSDWGRWLVGPFPGDMDRMREAILLGGLEDGEEVQEG